MEIVSVSKGVFPVECYKFGRKKIKNENENSNKPWYQTYKQIYQTIQDSVERINYKMYKQILQDLYWYVQNISNGEINILPTEISTAILLAGINVPDHIMLFDKVEETLREITPYIATISSKNCNNLKSMVEESVYQIINAETKNDPIIKKVNCTFRALTSWYNESNENNIPLVIIIKDFENFNAKTLHDFVYNLSMHSRLKIVLILGIATSLHIVHRTLSYDVTSKLRIKVFSTQTQLLSLSDILEGIVFSHNVPFKLTGKAFKFLEDMFLFYDLSVDGFLQAYKICLAKHFFENNYASLCCDINNVERKLKSLTGKHLREFRKLPSIAYYFQGKQNLEDEDFKKFLSNCVNEFQNYMDKFLSVLKLLHNFANTCPSLPFGKHFRQIYGDAVSSNLTELDNYTKVLQYLLHLPKEEFLAKFEQVLKVAENNKKFLPENLMHNLKKHYQILQGASEVILPSSSMKSDIQKSPNSDVKFNKRSAFHNSLRNNAHKQTCSPYKEARENFVDYIDKQIFSVFLKNPKNLLGYEIFCFHDNRLVTRQIKGSLRAAIENSLNNPNLLLECPCCVIDNETEILQTMPDIVIIYKLHKENKKLINMYDWLQSFLIIIDPEQIDEQRDINPVIKSRFSQAVAELQFLGYIKGTKIKTDHVKRLVY
ncbi:origin recognition complex subunit 3 [Leptopilina boulardi]|uniref:origin recognition complex subunit 3 n=1 Tax=Leptopilina boulardi TaxID=63433 RepID=UPI0021F6641A|nr:origin recognition complex subunit 3 [Leptopilina boulardi]